MSLVKGFQSANVCNHDGMFSVETNAEETNDYYREFGLEHLGDGRLATRDGGEQLRVVQRPTRRLVELGVGCDDRDDLAFCEWLVKEGGVAAIPISAFYESPPADQRLIRFCFAKSDATLEQAAERLRAL